MINHINNKKGEIVKELISTPPHKITRLGFSIIALIYITLLLLLFNIYYPEILVSKITITTKNFPNYIVTQDDCLIYKLLKENKQYINKGDTIAIIIHIKTKEDIKYLKSSISGKLIYSETWVNNQYIQKDKIIFKILPENSTKESYIGSIKIPALISDKIHIGQKVFIYLDEYPHTEFGILTGNIILINKELENGFCSIIINVPQITDLNKKISINCISHGKAKIFIKEKSFGEKILESLSLNKR